MSDSKSDGKVYVFPSRCALYDETGKLVGWTGSIYIRTPLQLAVEEAEYNALWDLESLGEPHCLTTTQPGFDGIF